MWQGINEKGEGLELGGGAGASHRMLRVETIWVVGDMLVRSELQQAASRAERLPASCSSLLLPETLCTISGATSRPKP